MATAQVPPAVGTSGQLIDVVTINAGSTIFREVVAIGSGFTSSGIAVVTTSGGLTVNVTSGIVALSSGTVTLSSNPTVVLSSPTSLSSGIVTLSSAPTVNISSGIVTLSSVPTVTATAATNPWSSAPSFNVPVVSASSGLVQIAGTPTVVSASSGAVQIVGTPTVTIVGTSGAIAPATSSGGLSVTIVGGAASGSTAVNLVGTSSGGFIYGSTGGGLLVELTNVDALALTSGMVTLSSDVAVSSGVINLSSAAVNYVTLMPSSGGIIPATSSGGLGVSILSGSASSTSFNLVGTSSGGFIYGSTGGGLLVELTNVDVLALTSGLVTLSSDIGVSSGVLNLSSAAINYVSLMPSSGGVIPATSSGGLGVTILAGSGAASTVATNPWSSAPSFNIPVVNASSGKVSISSGTITLSSATSLSSGIVTLSSVHTVTATAATNPWSSAPSFNVPIVSASSGLVQISGNVSVQNVGGGGVLAVSASSGGVTQVIPQTSYAPSVFSYVSSSSNNSNLVTGSPAAFFGYAVFNTTGTQRYIKIYQTSSAPGVGTTANLLMTLGIPGSTAGGAGANMISAFPLAYSTKGLGFTITDSPLTTSTGTIGQNDLVVNFFYVT